MKKVKEYDQWRSLPEEKWSETPDDRFFAKELGFYLNIKSLGFSSMDLLRDISFLHNLTNQLLGTHNKTFGLDSLVWGLLKLAATGAKGDGLSIEEPSEPVLSIVWAHVSSKINIGTRAANEILASRLLLVKFEKAIEYLILKEVATNRLIYDVGVTLINTKYIWGICRV